MARKSQLKSDRKFTIDSVGRLRIGGRFASRRQVGAWKSARARRGLSTAPQKSAPKTKRAVDAKASRTASKSALTRKAQSEGAYFNREYRTPRANFQKREYVLDDLSPAAIEAAIRREIYERKAIVLMNGSVEGKDDDDNSITVGTKFMRAIPENAEAMAEVLGNLAGVYMIIQTDQVTLTFSFARQEGG